MVLHDLNDVTKMRRSDLLFAMNIVHERNDIPEDVVRLIEAMYDKLESISSIFCQMEHNVEEFNQTNNDKNSYSVPMMQAVEKIAQLLRYAFES
jgi:hypothetical protein